MKPRLVSTQNLFANRSCPIKIADKEVIDRVFHQLFFPEDPETLIEFMGLADDFVQKLPFFVLKCNISAEAVRVAYETLSKV